jgi:plastocyanin
MRCRVALAVVCASAFSFVDSTVDSAKAAERVTHTVIIDGLKYIPETVTVKRGDSVVWINKDPFPHTVTAAGVFDSHSIDAGKSWKYIARKGGDYRYICTLHPNMTGTLKVE